MVLATIVNQVDVQAGGLRSWSWEKIEELVLAQQQRIAELEQRLRQYENPHTPPSLERRRDHRRPPSGGKKRGAPVGHAGATRPVPEVSRSVVVQDEVCASCQSQDVATLGVEKRVITDLGPVLQPESTEYLLTQHECKRCGRAWTAKHPDCPKVGVFGIRTLVFASMLRHHLRGPIRRVQDYLRNHHALDLSTKGVYDLLARSEHACKAEYDETVKRVRASAWVHVDETGHKIKGEKVWLWVFRSKENDVLVVIRPSRGKDVVEEILGSNPGQVIIVDGAKAYNGRRKQRCWAHLLRIVDEGKDSSVHALQLSQQVHALYQELVAFHAEEHSLPERQAKKIDLERRLLDAALDLCHHEDLDPKVNYIQLARDEWATCLLYPGMPATNNPAEQAIREHVVRRKLFQTFQSDAGAQGYQYMASLLDGWRLRGKNPFDELEIVLRRQLCQ